MEHSKRRNRVSSKKCQKGRGATGKRESLGKLGIAWEKRNRQELKPFKRRVTSTPTAPVRTLLKLAVITDLYLRATFDRTGEPGTYPGAGLIKETKKRAEGGGTNV